MDNKERGERNWRKGRTGEEEEGIVEKIRKEK